MSEEEKILVTRSYLPKFEIYVNGLKKIWQNNQLTNQGEYVRELESKLKDYLKVPFLSLQTNGTLSLQIAIKSLEIKGEVITTPFSYVATTNSILWEGCKPVFADIDPQTFCINPQAIEKLITENSTAILATHVFGIPCDIAAIKKIADKYSLKIIYDAAHAFGVQYKGQSILNFGDVSTLSLHATKLFHTVEGGVTVCQTKELYDRLNYSRSFGHIGEEYFGLGINAKMSEFHALMGLCVLPDIEEIINDRKKSFLFYKSELNNSILFPIIPDYTTKYNYSYFPIVLPDINTRKVITEKLQAENIFTRRYFYPSLNNLPHFQGEKCPVSESISERIICLPMFYGLDQAVIQKISKIINDIMI
jgi:dTDP-4-amino-4,6-dideoxygalactose transaminase